jgi:DeoR family suf operon transcriptional repressor
MTGVRSDETAELSARRRTVLYAVRRRGEATVEEIADQLAMTASGARQHLNALMADGLVEATEFEPDEPRRGRRTIVYSATEAANVHFPKAYGELTNELLGYVRDADPDLIAAIFARRREHRIAGATARLGHLPTLGRKVAELARILDEDGYFARAEEVVPGVFHLVEHNCAIWAVAQRYGHACESEIDFIRSVLPDAEVRRVEHMVAGARRCAYEIREASGTAA